tara:strand:- start:1142 stop:2263 length:1122 start_codon:yes stop_codon:yes gene_type:complete
MLGIKSRAFQLNLKANEFKQLENFTQAEEYVREAIRLDPAFAEAYSNLGTILISLGKFKEAKESIRKAVELRPYYRNAIWNLFLLSENKEQASQQLEHCLSIKKNDTPALIHLSAVKLHQGDNTLYKQLLKKYTYKNPVFESLEWISTLPNTPELFFHREFFYDEMVKRSITSRPFYEFGVYKGDSFKYLVKSFKQGFGFDNFTGLPESWNQFNKGDFSTQGKIPSIQGGTFISGNFEDTLPDFFNGTRPLASILHFDADLYSSTLCALNHAKSVIDKNTILIFDEFIAHETWKENEYQALDTFCSQNHLDYEVIAVSYTTCQAAVKIDIPCDPVEEYFSCVSECYLADPECEEQCVTQLRESPDPQLDVCSF